MEKTRPEHPLQTDLKLEVWLKAKQDLLWPPCLVKLPLLSTTAPNPLPPTHLDPDYFHRTYTTLDLLLPTLTDLDLQPPICTDPNPPLPTYTGLTLNPPTLTAPKPIPPTYTALNLPLPICMALSLHLPTYMAKKPHRLIRTAPKLRPTHTAQHPRPQICMAQNLHLPPSMAVSLLLLIHTARNLPLPTPTAVLTITPRLTAKCTSEIFIMPATHHRLLHIIKIASTLLWVPTHFSVHPAWITVPPVWRTVHPAWRTLKLESQNMNHMKKNIKLMTFHKLHFWRRIHTV